jgi:hypothetical protein
MSDPPDPAVPRAEAADAAAIGQLLDDGRPDGAVNYFYEREL